MDISTTFVKGRMNKSFDERVLPEGEYIDALNIRIGSTENNSVGAIENSLGNTRVAHILYEGNSLSTDAVCIGAYEDSQHETIYWFLHDEGNVDMVLSYNARTETVTYHVISTTVLNFSKQYLVNGIDLIDNLLFWTDNYNPPRKINVDRSYPYPTAGVDNITEDDISVIVAPPLTSPNITPLVVSTEENYMTDKFISFAYRYKYKDGEYSALSQFSNIAFEPQQFFVDYTTYTNGSMSNLFNNYNVSFDTGGENVIEVDLCFKLSDSSIVNVIERYIKNEQGWGDNEIKSIQFNNKKIYTALTSSELTRLFDNVPRIARSQTTMGNRLIYGNYVDGYDIDTSIDYEVVGLSEQISGDIIEVTTDNSIYNINPSDPKNIPGSVIILDFTGIDILADSVLSIDFSLFHEAFSGDPSYETNAPLNEFNFPFYFNIPINFDNAYQLSQNQSFIDAIYTHQPITQCGDGFSLTDIFNCQMTTIQTAPPDWDIVGTGINAVDQGFTIITTPSEPNIIKLQIPAIKFSGTDDPNPVIYAYEYLSDVGTTATISKLESKKSLHSNRDYEVGIVYQDEYLRSSTALVCEDNTVFFPASTSDSKNYIKAIINNLAPTWAKRYKFVVKPSKSKYETIYTNLFFQDSDGFTWFKLEGENISKVKTAQKLIVKRDSNGGLDNLVTTTVLDVQAQSDNFITKPPTSDKKIYEPAGVYMKIRVSNFEIQYEENSFIEIKPMGSDGWSYTNRKWDMTYANPDYEPSNPIGPTNQVRIPYKIPAGSLITFNIGMSRKARDFDSGCGSRNYSYKKTVISNQDYDNFYLFCQGENINFEDGIIGGGDDTVNTNEYNRIAGVYDPVTLYGKQYYFIPPYWDTLTEEGVNRFQFQYVYEDVTPSPTNPTGGLYLMTQTGTPRCSNTIPPWLPGTNARGSYVGGVITIQQATSLIVFETEPLDADGEIYYEGSDSFEIIDGYHQSGDAVDDQNQTSTQPAKVTLNFFDCFSFGNGVESYKIYDSLTGDPFYLGERVTAVAEEEYKEAHRYATLTYSGIYNAETNINRLNEFNLSLANFKDLEKVFGPINKLYARRTDILTLQEDKISYVLAGKNLLSDSAGGGQIASIPEVLGTQIARIEDFGISNNPESFAVFGGEVYFTDIKRNAVLNLRGGSAQSDALGVVSDAGMKYWFRDKFKEGTNYFKIGGYDPYMDEYVLHLTETSMPEEANAIGCGVTISKQNFTGEYKYEVELGNDIGEVTFSLTLFGGEVTVVVEYDEVTVVDEFIEDFGDYSFTFDKQSVLPKIATVTITATDATFTTNTSCVDLTDYITVYRVVYNNPGQEGNTIHNQYKWSLGSYSSPYNIDYVVLEADGVSLYNSANGALSQGLIPANLSDITLVSNKRSGDTFIFNPTLNSFKYLVSNTLYTANDLLPLLNTITPITGTYQATIPVATLAGYDYLYLVWDYRSMSEITLCYDETNPYALCCFCSISDTFYINSDSFTTATGIWTDETQATLATDGYYMIDGVYRQLLLGVLLDPVPCTGCDTQTQCFEGFWEIDDPIHPNGGSITYVNADGDTITQDHIWLGDVVTITYIDIISFTGVEQVECNLELSLRSHDGSALPDDVCTETLDDTIYIITQTSPVISNGDIVCNTTDANDRFDGGGLYYKLNIQSAPSGYEYNCLVDENGVITVYENCPE